MLELAIDGAVSRYAVIVGLVSVLLVNVSEPAKVAKVPVVGKVTFVVAVVVNVVAKAPEVVKFPASDKEPVVKVNDAPEPVVFNNVPDVGKVTEVLAVAVNVWVNAPE